MKKKNIEWPQYIKDAKGKITHVYLPMEAYEVISKELKEYEALTKKNGIQWVEVSSIQKTLKAKRR